jgi:hypothetical protein
MNTNVFVEFIKQYSGTPFQIYLNYSLIENDINRQGILLKILKDPSIIEKVRTKAQKKLKSTNWDKPRIVSILDLKTETKEEPKAFDYQTEVRQMTKYLLKQNNGTLTESPKRVWRRIQDCKSTKETLNILTKVLKPSAYRENERLELLEEMADFPTDGFLIAKHLSTDNKAVAKVWDRDPKKDMSTGDELRCCTLPSQGPDYLVDPNISMIDFFATRRRYAKAILVACKDEKDKVLLVDSIEGSQRIFDNYPGRRDLICKFMTGSIEHYGNETGFDSVVYNARADNRDHIYGIIFDRIPGDEEDLHVLKSVFRKRATNSNSYIESFRYGYLHRNLFIGHSVRGKKTEIKKSSDSLKD